jgi:predicted amidophosphoribosyltransferase
MDVTRFRGQPRSLRQLRGGREMGLFRSKQLGEAEDERCPNCRERVPYGAVACMMCGLALEPVRAASRDSEEKRPAARR